MTKKLFSLADNKCIPETVDALMMQECLMGGYLYLQVLKEKICLWLSEMKKQILKRASITGELYTLTMRKCLAYSCKLK
jgi:DNA-directed RNA polymerase I subunit RPA2